MNKRKRFEDATEVTREDLIEGVRLVFRGRNLMFAQMTEDGRDIHSVYFNLTDDEGEVLRSFGANVKQYQGNYRVLAGSYQVTRDGRILQPPVITDANGERYDREKLVESGIPNGTRADVFVWAKQRGVYLPLRLSGIQLIPKIKVNLTSRGFELIEEEI